MNIFYQEYLDNVKFLISNKDKLTEKQQQGLACLPLEHMTIKTHYAFAKWLRALLSSGCQRICSPRLVFLRLLSVKVRDLAGAGP